MSEAIISTPWGDCPIGGEDLDTLTVKFWLDSPGPLYQGPPPPITYAAQVGPDPIAGVCGFGPTPLAALRDLCENLARHGEEMHRTDNGRLLLR